MAEAVVASHVLDDVVWHALSGPQEHLALVAGGGTVRRYDADVGPFCGVQRLDAAAWAALGGLLGVGGVAVFLRGQVEAAPPGWTELLREPATQYVAGLRREVDPAGRAEVVELGGVDSADMMRLTAETEPGPFGSKSHLTGRWFGIRREGRLVAMAGERMRVDGYGEVSGVCVDPSVRGQGLGAVVTAAAADAIRERGDRPILHVREGNEGAHRLYRRLGFEVRREVVVAILRFDGGVTADSGDRDLTVI